MHGANRLVILVLFTIFITAPLLVYLFNKSDLKTSFRLVFYHQEMHFKVPVKINEIRPEGITEIKYDPENFSFGNLTLAKASTAHLGYAGFRVLYPIQ